MGTLGVLTIGRIVMTLRIRLKTVPSCIHQVSYKNVLKGFSYVFCTHPRKNEKFTKYFKNFHPEKNLQLQQKLQIIVMHSNDFTKCYLNIVFNRLNLFEHWQGVYFIIVLWAGYLERSDSDWIWFGLLKKWVITIGFFSPGIF